MVNSKQLPYYSRKPNKMPNVRHFIDRWKRGYDETRVFLYKHNNGCVNSTKNNSTSFMANSITPKNDSFQECIEENIRPLVYKIIERGLITYTSCQGHIVDEELHLAHVGVIWNDQNDFELIKDITNHDDFCVYRSHLEDMETKEAFETIEIYINLRKGEQPLDYLGRVNETLF